MTCTKSLSAPSIDPEEIAYFENLAQTGDQFDAVLNMEVVEHVDNLSGFLPACGELLRPGGLMVVATINRTLAAFLIAIVGAEYVLGWMPKGTHHWHKLVKPSDVTTALFLGKPVASYGASANYCAYHLMSGSVVDTRKVELADYKTSKGTVRFPVGAPLPPSLIQKLVKTRVAEIQ